MGKAAKQAIVVNKLLLIALVIAAVIIGGAMILARNAADNEPQGPEFGFENNQVVVEGVYQSCAAGDRCIVVDTHCGFCCKYTAINARYEPAYNASFDKNCKHFSGQYCHCFDLSSYPSCVDGKCQLVPWPDQKSPAPKPAQTQRSTPASTSPPEWTRSPPVEPEQPEAPIEPESEPTPYMAPEPMPDISEPVAPVTPEPAPSSVPAPIPEPTYQQAPQPVTPEPSPQDDSASDDLFAPLPDEMPATLPGQNDGFGSGYDNDPLNRPLPTGNR